MLRAILQGKAGRVSSSDSDFSWRQLFREREDLLTSVFFSRIPYLSPGGASGIFNVLIKGLGSDGLGLLEEMIFWPKLSATGGRRFVEPDVLIQFPGSTVLVEVKAPAGSSQNLLQWKAEIEALIARDDSDEEREQRKLYFLAIGRNSANWKEWKSEVEKDFSDYRLEVHVIEWSQIRDGVAGLFSAGSRSDNAVYADWLDAFSLYGIHAPIKSFEEISLAGLKVEGNLDELFENYPVVKSSLEWNELSQFSCQLKLEVTTWH